MGITKLVLFTVLQILLLPLFIVGSVMIATKQFLVSKKLGLSGTAVEVLQTRWIQHYYGGRKDPITIQLAKGLPNMSHTGMHLAMSAITFMHRLFNYVPSILSVPEKGKENFINFIYSRHTFFDEVIEKNLDDMEQIVLMGAGFDSRSFTYCQKEHLSVFELDQTNTQQVKADVLKKMGLDTEFITFVPVDFNSEDWHEKLISNGFDSDKKTLFLWEGVTLYLEEAEVRKTLQRISDISAPGSILALDLYSLSFVELAAKRGGGVYKNTTGETFGFGLDFATDPQNRVKELLDDVNLQISQIHLCGDEREGKEPMVALVEATVS